LQELFQAGENLEREGSELQRQKNNSLPSVYTASTPIGLCQEMNCK
jgi:hypothetical protein